MPMIAFIGVRISWLIEASKVLFPPFSRSPAPPPARWGGGGGGDG